MVARRPTDITRPLATLCLRMNPSCSSSSSLMLLGHSVGARRASRQLQAMRTSPLLGQNMTITTATECSMLDPTMSLHGRVVAGALRPRPSSATTPSSTTTPLVTNKNTRITSQHRIGAYHNSKARKTTAPSWTARRSSGHLMEIKVLILSRTTCLQRNFHRLLRKRGRP